MTIDEWVKEQNNMHRHHFGKDFDSEQLDIMREIYKKYAKNGEIDWHDHTMYNSAWYEFMNKIVGIG